MDREIYSTPFDCLRILYLLFFHPELWFTLIYNFSWLFVSPGYNRESILPQIQCPSYSGTAST